MPTYGPFQFNKIQLGRESTAGTAVAATTVYRGQFAMPEDTRDRQIVEEQIGLMVPAERSFDAWLGAQLQLPATAMTFEQVGHWLEGGIKTVTPTGAGPYVYTYAPPTGTTLNTIKTYTIEAGNVAVTGDVREVPYAYVEQMQFSGQTGQAWQMQGTWRGQRVVSSTFTGSLSAPAVEEAVFGNTSLYIDATGGTIGTTQKSGTLMGADIQINTGIQHVPVGDGNNYYSAHKFTGTEITFTITLELEDGGQVAAERAIYESDAIRLIRLDVAGTSSRQIRFDIAAKYDSVSSYENSDGNTTVTFSGHAAYSSTDSLYFEAEVTNNLSAIP